MKRLLGLALLSGSLVFLGFGCGPSYNSVECEVVDESGNPVEDATVVFEKEGETAKADITKAGAAPTGLTGKDGKCKMETGAKKGVIAGNYKVLITKIPKQDMDENLSNEERMKKFNEGTAGKPGGVGGGPGGGAKPPGGGTTASKNLIDDKFSKVDSTDLKATVPTSGTLKFTVKVIKK